MGLITSEDLENFVEDQKKVFDLMHVANAEGVKIAAYKLKIQARTCFDQWKEGRDKHALHPSWGCLEEVFLGHFFP